MNRGSLLRGRGISIHEGGYYHEPVTTADLRLYQTSNNFVVKGILELQGWTYGMDPDSDWVMSALLVSCPQPRLRYV